MQATRTAAAMVLLVGGVLSGRATAQGQATVAELLKAMTGTWKAPEERTPRTSALDEQVFGAGAVDVRTVTLVMLPSGEGDLQVRRSVVSGKGKVFAPSIVEVKMRIGEPVTSEFGHAKPTVTVTSAEERYLDGDHERWTRDGSRVSLSMLDLTSKELNLQFDTPDGRGAFGATLTRASGTAAARSSTGADGSRRPPH